MGFSAERMQSPRFLEGLLGHTENHRFLAGSYQLETDLKCLGAFRLVKIAGLKTLEAAKYTQKILGEELYVESTNWSEAVSRVGSVIENFASRMDGFSH